MSLITSSKKVAPSFIIRILNRGPSAIRNLPEELLMKIFGFLSAKELVKVSKVCKQWNCIAQDNALWKQLFYKIPDIRKSYTKFSFESKASFKQAYIEAYSITTDLRLQEITRKKEKREKQNSYQRKLEAEGFIF